MQSCNKPSKENSSSKRAEEGTGQELFEAIQEEKQKLIKEGKLKKQKALPEITEDEIPFEIPETWKWVRLGGLGKSNWWVCF